MYAVIRAGGKQYRVAPGDVIEVERLPRASNPLRFTPLLVVEDDGRTRAGRAELGSAAVVARVLGASKGPKVDIFKYRPKTRYRRRTGHRQAYTTIEISEIELEGAKSDGT